MTDRQQMLRERAYWIWEEEGRPEGRHQDHWKRAEDQHQMTEQEAKEVADANHEMDEAFAERTEASGDESLKTPSMVNPD